MMTLTHALSQASYSRDDVNEGETRHSHQVTESVQVCAKKRRGSQNTSNRNLRRKPATEKILHNLSSNAKFTTNLPQTMQNCGISAIVGVNR